MTRTKMREPYGVPDKVLPLGEAVARCVRPGMTLHLAGGIGGPGAAICELVRHFRGQTPQFTLVQSTVTGHALTLVHRGLLKKLVFAGCMEISDSARPSAIFQRAFRERALEVENWSLCSLQQRLMAGAMGLPFLPTRSLSGSALASELEGDFREVPDPFGGGGSVGVVRALRPDLSIVHGCVADVQGNTVLGAPVGDDLWGALASAGGVLVTVEEIVPTDVIREYSSLVKIPGYAVTAVCRAPMGAHPFSFSNPGVPGVSSYEMDRPFLASLAKATREGSLDRWLDEWVLGCDSHDEFLAKLGPERLEALRDGRSGSGESDARSVPAGGEACTPEEVVLVAVAREIVAAVKRAGHKVLLVGAGSRTAGAWLAYTSLRSEGREVDLVTGNGQVGYAPLPGETFLQTPAGMATSKMLTDTITTHGVIVGGANSACLSVLGAAQVDRCGNLNTTRLSEERFLVGSGGSNDSVNAREVIVVMDQSRERFVEKLPYVTSSGERVTTVISQFGVFRKAGGSDELRLVSYFPQAGPGRSRALAAVRDACGWALETEEALQAFPPPTEAELRALRALVSSAPAQT